LEEVPDCLHKVHIIVNMFKYIKETNGWEMMCLKACILQACPNYRPNTPRTGIHHAVLPWLDEDCRNACVL
jgi:hypothetical protein